LQFAALYERDTVADMCINIIPSFWENQKALNYCTENPQL